MIGPMVCEPPAQCTTPFSRPFQAVVGVHDRGDLVLVGDVGGLVVDVALRRDGLDLVDGRGEAIGVAADDHDVGAGLGQPLRHALADTAATTGDQVRPILERELHAALLTQN